MKIIHMLMCCAVAAGVSHVASGVPAGAEPENTGNVYENGGGESGSDNQLTADYDPEAARSWLNARAMYRSNVRAVRAAFARDGKAAKLSPPALKDEVDPKSITSPALLSAILGLNHESSAAYLRRLRQLIKQGGAVVLDVDDYIVIYLAMRSVADGDSGLVQSTLGTMVNADIVLPNTRSGSKYTELADFMKAALYMLYDKVDAVERENCEDNIRNSNMGDPLLKLIVPIPEAPEPAPLPKGTKKGKKH